MFWSVFLSVVLFIVSFSAGVLYAEHNAKVMRQEINMALQRQYYRLKAGVDADDPVQPYGDSVAEQQIEYNNRKGREPFRITEDFVTKMKENGRATTMIKKTSS